MLHVRCKLNWPQPQPAIIHNYRSIAGTRNSSPTSLSSSYEIPFHRSSTTNTSGSFVLPTLKASWPTSSVHLSLRSCSNATTGRSSVAKSGGFVYTSSVSLVRRCRCYQTDCSWEETEVAEDEEEETRSPILRLIYEWHQKGREQNF